LIGKPPQSIKRNEAVAPNQHEPTKSVTHARQANGSALISYSIVQEQMARVHLDANSIAI
jgi:hypothetical protein